MRRPIPLDGRCAALSYSTVDGEPGGDLGVDTYAAFSISVLSRGSKDSEDHPEGGMVHCIEGRFRIQESDVQLSVLVEFLSLLND